jgi:hypothetical protein
MTEGRVNIGVEMDFDSFHKHPVDPHEVRLRLREVVVDIGRDAGLVQLLALRN